MGRRKRGNDVDGVVLLDKPLGLSSNTALQRVRGVLDARKAGHTGSLDPLATGLLPICLGEATKLSSYLLADDKTYRVTARLGAETTTGDAEGDISETSSIARPDDHALSMLLGRFIGDQTQVPPMYSALKVDGKPLYAYAREGRTIGRTARPIHVYELELVSTTAETITLDVTVSGGTYIRTLVEDIARVWGGRAYVSALRRTRVGTLGQIHSMTTIDDLQACDVFDRGLVYPATILVQHWPEARLDTAQARAIGQGQTIHGPWSASSNLWRIVDGQGYMLGIGECRIDGVLRPKRLFSRLQF